ncbi:MAG: oligosaccharide flippase family protein [Verrucomicrobiae bacterium]|nr:oligosaccharide flippase family protein [Verrucomicrobiae bacterium]
MGWVVSNILRSALVKDVSVIFSGLAFSQLIGFALAPVISRLFSPEDFGVASSFGAISSIILSFVTLEYASALVLPKQTEEAGQLFILSCATALIITALLGVVCIVAPGWFFSLLKSSEVLLLFLLVMGTLIGGINTCLQAWCVRTKAFPSIAVSQVIRGLSNYGLQVGCGLLKCGAIGIVLGNVIGDAFAGANLFRVARGKLRGFIGTVSYQRLKAIAHAYYDFPLYSATQNVLNAVSNGLPVLLLGHSYGIAIAGAYAFGMRLLHVPVSLVTASLRHVVFQRASEAQQNEQPLTPLFLKVTAGLFCLGILPTLVLIAAAPKIFVWVFGSQWATAGEFARYLVIWLFFAFCNQPAVLLARVIRIQRTVFLYNVGVLLSRWGLLLIGGRYLSPLECVALFSVLGAFLNIFLIALVGYVLVKREGSGEIQLLPGSP